MEVSKRHLTEAQASSFSEQLIEKLQQLPEILESCSLENVESVKTQISECASVCDSMNKLNNSSNEQMREQGAKLKGAFDKVQAFAEKLSDAPKFLPKVLQDMWVNDSLALSLNSEQLKYIWMPLLEGKVVRGSCQTDGCACCSESCGPTICQVA